MPLRRLPNPLFLEACPRPRLGPIVFDTTKARERLGWTYEACQRVCLELERLVRREDRNAARRRRSFNPPLRRTT